MAEAACMASNDGTTCEHDYSHKTKEVQKGKAMKYLTKEWLNIAEVFYNYTKYIINTRVTYYKN